MRLYLVHADPLHTTLVSANGVSQYRISTPTNCVNPLTSRIRRPMKVKADSDVADITWGGGGHVGVVRSGLFNFPSRTKGAREVKIKDLLYHPSAFGRSRAFIGDDGDEYRWKWSKTFGQRLFHVRTGAVTASYRPELYYVHEGVFRGQRKASLLIDPLCAIDFDIIVLTFVIMEKKRRDKLHHENTRKEDAIECGMAEASAEGGGGC
ncbi:TonB box-containing protein [Artomyces pyxidatus]|uniref:TonB box-containing protein n=1 Tax=Artomyces pyxidatus TaxID=48021 RepID=A0ACB8ST19_9AGAM|nr:TonB box-containing protein [Artomyces pyxidatus]